MLTCSSARRDIGTVTGCYSDSGACVNGDSVDSAGEEWW